MKASVERLRWVLAGAAVLLLVVLVGFLSYGRYRAKKLWGKIVAQSGVHVAHETDGFTYSQTLKGHTVFTLHAAKAVQHEDGKWTLHDVVVTLYSKNSTDADHVYCSDVEYDEGTGVATALGEVHMDLQVPNGVGRKGTAVGADGVDANGEGPGVIHVKTSGLVFVKKLGVAATPQPVEFLYAGMKCTAVGAEFDSGESGLHLLADVVLTGVMKGEPVTVHAGRADLDRESNTVVLARAVGESHGRKATASSAVLHLRKDGSVEAAEGSGGVVFEGSGRKVTGTTFAGTFGATSLPVSAKVSGGVLVTDSSATRPVRGQAAEMDMTYGAAGELRTVLGVGGAQIEAMDKGLPREIRGDRILGTFVPVVLGRKTGSRLSEMHAMGGAMAKGESADAKAGGTKKTQVFADDLRAAFESAGQHVMVTSLVGSGGTRLVQEASTGASQTSSGDALQVEFARGGAGAKAEAQISQATQTGHVVIHSVPTVKAGAATQQGPSDAAAAKAVYDGASEKLTLTGEARFAQGDTSLTAGTITLDQRTGDAAAEGGVMASLAPSNAASAKASTTAEVTHVSAERARLSRASGLDEFLGTDARPARLWQGASQVQAASLLFDQKKKTLAARPGSAGGLVHAVFADAGTGKPRRDGKMRGPSVVRVASSAMDYDDVRREATFTGGVRMDGDTGVAKAQRGVVFLDEPKTKAADARPNPFGAGGSLRRIVLNGDVMVDQPGRIGTGEQLVYTAADQSFILTGTAAKPPHVVDATQGSITGATLLFHTGDKSVVASGAPGEKQGKPGRVRTETELKQ